MRNLVVRIQLQRKQASFSRVNVATSSQTNTTTTNTQTHFQRSTLVSQPNMFKVVSTLVLGVFVATTSARTHYGDPNTIFGCLPDEVKATITGLAGDLCIPPCAPNGTCPQDKPVGASSMPGCVLTSSTGDKYCALVCTPADEDAQCGQHASCKQGPKDGLCTFDDIPKPPSSEHWVPVVSV